MHTESIFIAHPTNRDQINALKAVVKAFKVKFEIKKEFIVDEDEPNKTEILNGIKESIQELKLIQQGKVKGTSLESFLNEI